ncbi:methylated-DNA--[protein]-cysteine S-methyltransferase [Clostridium sp. Ade.TY]|uniref:methylated-DNA--[protein]-cysteine S-methyltransferase n=1 Tax=Clostridium sp. Ade.TY TaxID=1391647 RepID=UPI000408DFC5|nr:methylated-DNA--[protein]-cysteine S-methyltransferase [Clostridium sp. Ade.TY]
MINTYCYDTKLGEITIVEENDFITKIYFGNSKEINANYIETELIKDTKKQLEEYLIGNRKIFDLPINPKGTKFQSDVWKSLIKIPYGKTVSYKEIAISIGNEKASRAVGMANNKNPILIIIPCHRVVGSNGKLIGYAGGLYIKKKLLSIEKENFNK